MINRLIERFKEDDGFWLLIAIVGMIIWGYMGLQIYDWYTRITLPETTTEAPKALPFQYYYDEEDSVLEVYDGSYWHAIPASTASKVEDWKVYRINDNGLYEYYDTENDRWVLDPVQ